MALDLETLVQCVSEIKKESRSYRADYSSASQDLVLHIVLFPNASTTTGDKDQSTLAIEVAYEILPNVRMVPNQAGSETPLLLTQLSVDQTSTYGYKIVGKYTHNDNEGFSGTAGDDASEAEILPQLRLNFTIGGGTRRLNKSLSTTSVARTTPEAGFETPPDNRGAINATRDEIGGVDLPDDALKIQITVYYKPQFFNFALISKFRGVTSKLNSETFLEQPERSVLYLGSSGGGTVLDIIPVTHEFSIKDPIDQDDEGFAKLECSGFDVVDYQFKPSLGPADGHGFQEPVFRYIHKVFKEADLGAVLGFGADPGSEP